MSPAKIAVAALAVLLASCSGAVYDTSDFVSAPRAAAGKVRTTEPEPAEAPPGETVAADEEPPAEVAADTDSPPADEDGPELPAPAAADPATGPARGLLAFFRAPTPTPAADAAAEATATPPAAPSTAAAVAADDDLPVETAPPEGEISEAELAGEVEADPDVIAVPTPPDDGLAHDFVNVYTSRPELIEPAVAGLPGVNWDGGLITVSRGPDGDAGSLFGGGDHPFARSVPGLPRQTVQAANGLLLAHSAINVSCVKPNLLGLVRRAETHFGRKVVITSGYRSPAHNRRVRGAVHSQHMYCNALDLYMPGVARDDLARFFFAQPDRGGIGLYCHTRSIHIDTGKRRQWRWSCRRRAG